jgi:hypothetical protein
MAAPLLLGSLQNNVVYFRVAGLGLMSGNLSIKASYKVESEQRVSIQFIESTLVSGSRDCRVPWCEFKYVQLPSRPQVVLLHSTPPICLGTAVPVTSTLYTSTL